MSADQPVEHTATLADVRAEVHTPDRVNSVVFGIVAAVALAIAVVGVAGVLAFWVSARTREFGIRLGLGSEPQRLLKDVIAEGTVWLGRGSLQVRHSGSHWCVWREDISWTSRCGRNAGGCLCVRADGGRGDRVGAARGTRCAR